MVGIVCNKKKLKQQQKQTNKQTNKQTKKNKQKQKRQMNQTDNAISMDLYIIVIHVSRFSLNISELIMFYLSFRSYDQSFNF